MVTKKKGKHIWAYWKPGKNEHGKRVKIKKKKKLF